MDKTTVIGPDLVIEGQVLGPDFEDLTFKENDNTKDLSLVLSFSLKVKSLVLTLKVKFLVLTLSL